MDKRPVRLTRRGRWVLTVVLAMVLLGGLAWATPASLAAGATSGRMTAVVQPGDSLWSVAARELPGVERYAAVKQLRRLNRLDGTTVHPGQRLVLPR